MWAAAVPIAAGQFTGQGRILAVETHSATPQASGSVVIRDDAQAASHHNEQLIADTESSHDTPNSSSSEDDGRSSLTHEQQR